MKIKINEKKLKFYEKTKVQHLLCCLLLTSAAAAVVGGIASGMLAACVGGRVVGTKSIAHFAII